MNRFVNSFVNLAFLEPIGHEATLRESVAMCQNWQKIHYPQYRATLISSFFASMAKACGLKPFYDCWLRELEDDGYPQYRSHSTYAASRFVEAYEKLPNVYASLVMSEDDFARLNPTVDRQRYNYWF